MDQLNILVLAGGPDAEREVSLKSGEAVAGGLAEAGHRVLLRDIQPDDLAGLDEYEQWGGHVVFPALHGPWGEGGGLQRLLDDRGYAYVGSAAAAADLAMDKQLAKLVFQQHEVPTPEFEFLRPGQPITMPPPLVIKPYNQGSSIGVRLCPDADAVAKARGELAADHGSLLIERMIQGKEMTVGVLGGVDGVAGRYEALPPIQVTPAEQFYDYHAKYQSDATRYSFEIDLPQATLQKVRDLALQAHRVLGCRHLSRVDFIVDDRGQAWCLEVNTMPGFTSQSLLPKAAKHAGISWPTLLDRLVRLALQ